MASMSATLVICQSEHHHHVEARPSEGHNLSFVALEIASPWDKKLSLYTDRPELLDEIAAKAKEGAAWLRERKAVSAGEIEKPLPF